MKKNIRNTLITILVAVSIASAACTAAAPAPASQASPALGAQETAALLFMVEEEKLAHDVYSALAAKWNAQAFANIAASEEKHVAEVSRLLSTYNIASPLKQPGVFTNPDLQQLYNQLVAQGSQSLAEAYKVGIAIEELDIRDLQTRLTQTSNASITLVFNNLIRASQNHLQAFTRASTGQNQPAGRGRPNWAGGPNH